MPLPGPPLSDEDLQKLADEIISEVFGDQGQGTTFAHSPHDTISESDPTPATTAIGPKFFTVDPAALSRANYAGLQKSFPGSPINKSPVAPIQLTPEDIRSMFVNLSLRGPVCDVYREPDKISYLPVPGYGFTFFNRNYWLNGAPDYDAVNQKLLVNWDTERYHEGDPGNAFMPNIISVPRGEVEGYGSLPKSGRPSRRVATMKTPQYGGAAFIGEGSALSPGKSSKQIAERTELVLGKSSLESIGALSDGPGTK
jgi:hypothetical protein